ncbi:MAG: DUF3786 domain-containing protein [Bilifractor sp.]
MPETSDGGAKELRAREASRGRFLKFDQEKILRIFGLRHDEETMEIGFLGRTYTIMRKTGQMYCEGREADSDEMASVYELLTRSPLKPQPVGTWKTIAQLCDNTTDTSLTRYVGYLKPFEEKPELLARACERLGGRKAERGDVSYIIPVFEGIDCWFQYWEKDDEFPPSVEFLWDSSITLHFRWSILWNIMTCICRRLLEEKENAEDNYDEYHG